jgi:SsrA-binding protein
MNSTNIISNNRKAFYEYHIIEEYDCGIILFGQEVKSVRQSNVTISDSFIYLKDGEVWVKNFKISRYKQSHPLVKHEENREKKLLLTKTQIKKISKLLEEKGVTCVPLSIFVKNNRIKVKIGVVKGKKLWDKRNSIKERDIKREIQRNSY